VWLLSSAPDFGWLLLKLLLFMFYSKAKFEANLVCVASFLHRAPDFGWLLLKLLLFMLYSTAKFEANLVCVASFLHRAPAFVWFPFIAPAFP